MEELKRLFDKYHTTSEPRLLKNEFAINGVTTHLSTNTMHVANAISEFLEVFKAESTHAKKSIEFSLLCTDDEIPTTDILINAKQVHDVGFLQYYERDNLRFTLIPDGGIVAADLAHNTAYGLINSSFIKDRWAISHLAFYPLWAQLLKNFSLFVIHAAGARIKDIAILFPAASGSGKSMLSYNLLNNGFEFLSDDTLLLYVENHQVSAIGFPEPINFRPDVFEVFPELRRSEHLQPENNRSRFQLNAGKEFPDSLIAEAVPRLIVFPKFSGKKLSQVERITKTDALDRLFKSSLFIADRHTSANHLQVLTRFVNQASCYQLQVGRDIDDLIKTVKNIAGGDDLENHAFPNKENILC
jgi:hypothetical protein